MGGATVKIAPVGGFAGPDKIVPSVIASCSGCWSGHGINVAAVDTI